MRCAHALQIGFGRVHSHAVVSPCSSQRIGIPFSSARSCSSRSAFSRGLGAEPRELRSTVFRVDVEADVLVIEVRGKLPLGHPRSTGWDRRGEK